MIAKTFFSTIALVSSTIIGFALAVFTVYFQINRQSRLDQTEEIIELVEEFADEYQEVLNRTKSMINVAAGPELDTGYKSGWASTNPEKLKQNIREDSTVEKPEVTYVYALMSGIDHICGTVASKQVSAGEIPDEKILEKLNELIKALGNYFEPTGLKPEWFGFYKELSEDVEKVDSIHDLYDQDIFPEGQSDYYFDSLAHWVKSQDEQIMRPYDHYETNGLGIESILILSKSMGEDYRYINRKLRGSLINHNPRHDLEKMVHKPASVAIVSFGLIIPLVMLLDLPTLTSTRITDLPLIETIELIQFMTIPILVVSFYCQFRCIFAEIIDVNPS